MKKYDITTTPETAIINKIIGSDMLMMETINREEAENTRHEMYDMIRESAEDSIADYLDADVNLTHDGLHSFCSIAIAALAISALNNVEWGRIGDKVAMQLTDKILDDEDEELARLLDKLREEDENDMDY
jgi:hypothetical protein